MFKKVPNMDLWSIADAYDAAFDCAKRGNESWFQLDLSTTDAVHRVSLKAKGCI